MIHNCFKFAIAGIMMTAGAVSAQSFTVENLNDAGPGSLREAITMANSTTDADTIEFSVTGTIELRSQLPNITSPMTIDGGGEITLHGGNGTDGRDVNGNPLFDEFGNRRGFGTGDGFRILNIDDDSSYTVTPHVVELRGLTITGGDAPRDMSADGGGIRNREDLTLINVHVTGNSAGDGGTMFSVGGNGGGIFNLGGNLTLIDSSVTGNRSGNGGTGSNGDSAGGEGGGIMSTFNQFGNDLVLIRSTVSGNTTGFGRDPGDGEKEGGRGGGIFSGSINTVLIDSTISGNSTQGIQADGAGIAYISSVRPRVITITNCTITDNFSSDTAGGIYTVRDAILLENSIVAGNTAVNGDTDITLFNGGSVIANFSMIEQDDLLIGGTGNIFGMSPSLGPLADNGGPTQTHALLAGSPAIDAGDPDFSGEFDQTGSARIAGGRVDIGSVEFSATDFVLGDANGDGVVSFLDITPFIANITGDVFQAESDIDGNGVVNFLDITPFIALLTAL